VYIDGEFAVGLSLWQVADFKLRIGQTVDSELRSQLLQAGEFGKLYDRTLTWLALRLRSEWEICEYLKRKTSDQRLQNAVIQQLDSQNYVDDVRFSQSWVHHRRQTKAMSRRRLQQELRSKRVADDIIRKVLSEDEVTDIETIQTLAHKKYRQTRYKDPQKLLAFLVRQGYDYSAAKNVIEELVNSPEQKS
jgi:regulatory protein